MASGGRFGVDGTVGAAQDGPGWFEWLGWLKRLGLGRLCLCQVDRRVDGLRCEVGGKVTAARSVQCAHMSALQVWQGAS